MELVEWSHTPVKDRDSGFNRYLNDWSEFLDSLRQNVLMNESAFLTFARDRGLRVSGTQKGDPGVFHSRGWLASDGTDYDGGPMFHPFRLYPLQQILHRCGLRIADSATVYERDRVMELVKWALESVVPTIEQISKAATRTNEIADLAILLEPLYWPRITGRVSYGISEDAYEIQVAEYREGALRLVETLDREFWREAHKLLRIDAMALDDNSSLYLLLRVSSWAQRERLKGRIAGALWIRHLAEVVRRGFEEAHGELWPEEDQAFGVWTPGSRGIWYGAERPLDDTLLSKTYLARHYELFTGSATRWYVEGTTEYWAVIQLLPEPARLGLEIVNLRGNIGAGRDNAALKLADWLREDRTLRRFSIITFDCDVPANVKAIRHLLGQHSIIGLIAAHEPDFEFANFAVGELVEVAAGIDESHGFPSEPVRNADWTGISRGGAFECRYCEVSARTPPSLKGEEWGRALASFAAEHPERSDDGIERPFWRQIRAAVNGWCSNYDYQKGHFQIDPITFKQIAKPANPKASNG